MQRGHLRLVPPVPVLREEYRAVRPAPEWKRWAEQVAETVLAGLAILTCMWAFAAFVLSLSVPR